MACVERSMHAEGRAGPGDENEIQIRALLELGAMVRDKLSDKPGKTIFIRADARAQYRAVEDAIDAVRTAGVEDVGLLTQKKESNLAGGE